MDYLGMEDQMAADHANAGLKDHSALPPEPERKSGMDVIFDLVSWGILLLGGWVVLIAFGFVAYGLWLVTSLLIGLF